MSDVWTIHRLGLGLGCILPPSSYKLQNKDKQERRDSFLPCFMSCRLTCGMLLEYQQHGKVRNLFYIISRLLDLYDCTNVHTLTLFHAVSVYLTWFVSFVNCRHKIWRREVRKQRRKTKRQDDAKKKSMEQEKSKHRWNINWFFVTNLQHNFTVVL